MTTYTKEIKCLDHGYVRYIDHMGSDARILEAARVSYRSQGKGEESDRKLLEYLWKNKHCYHSEMQVLTANGWKKWSECSNTENLLVPDNGILKVENCPILKYDVIDEKLETFRNNRMSFAVTGDHRMLFKSKYQSEFVIVRAKEMLKWGHFKRASDFRLKGFGEEESDRLKLVGFFLGDGFQASIGTLAFHFRKLRKIKYLRTVCGALNIEIRERQSSTHDDGLVMTIDKPEWIGQFIDTAIKGEFKQLVCNLESLDCSQIKGLLNGLINSDGSVKKDRPTIEFSSQSLKLAELFQNAASMLGLDAHFCKSSKGIYSVKAHKNDGRTSLEG